MDIFTTFYFWIIGSWCFLIWSKNVFQAATHWWCFFSFDAIKNLFFYKLIFLISEGNILWGFFIQLFFVGNGLESFYSLGGSSLSQWYPRLSMLLENVLFSVAFPSVVPMLGKIGLLPLLRWFCFCK